MQIKLNFRSTRVILQERVKLLALDLKNWEKHLFQFPISRAEMSEGCQRQGGGSVIKTKRERILAQE